MPTELKDRPVVSVSFNPDYGTAGARRGRPRVWKIVLASAVIAGLAWLSFLIRPSA